MSEVEISINTRTIEFKEVVLTLSVELANALNSVLYLVEGSSSGMRKPLEELSDTLDRWIGTPPALPSGCVDFDQMEDHRPKQSEKPKEPEEQVEDGPQPPQTTTLLVTGSHGVIAVDAISGKVLRVVESCSCDSCGGRGYANITRVDMDEWRTAHRKPTPKFKQLDILDLGTWEESYTPPAHAWRKERGIVTK